MLDKRVVEDICKQGHLFCLRRAPYVFYEEFVLPFTLLYSREDRSSFLWFDLDFLNSSYHTSPFFITGS